MHGLTNKMTIKRFHHKHFFNNLLNKLLNYGSPLCIDKKMEETSNAQLKNSKSEGTEY